MAYFTLEIRGSLSEEIRRVEAGFLNSLLGNTSPVCFGGESRKLILSRPTTITIPRVQIIICLVRVLSHAIMIYRINL